MAQRFSKYCIHNKIPLGWQQHQVVCRPTQCLWSILIRLTTKTAKTIFKARAYRWVHADVVNAVSRIIAVLGLFLSLKKFPWLPSLNDVWSLHPYWICLDVNGLHCFLHREINADYCSSSLHVLLKYCLVTMIWWLCYIKLAQLFLACGCYWLSWIS